MPLSGGVAFAARPPSASKLRFSATPHPKVAHASVFLGSARASLAQAISLAPI
jgi:hypothetical protein